MASKRVSGLQFKSAASFRNLLLLCVAAGMSSALTRALFLRLALNNEWYVLVAGIAIAFVFTGAFFLALRRIIDEFIACDAVLRRLILALIVSGATIAVLLAPSDQRTLTWRWAAGPQSGDIAPVFSGTSWDDVARKVIELHATNDPDVTTYGVWRVTADLSGISGVMPVTLELWVTQPSWAVIDPATNAPPLSFDGVDVIIRIEKGSAVLSEQRIPLDPPVAPEQRSWRRVVVDLPSDAERLSVEVAMRQTVDYDRVWVTEATVHQVIGSSPIIPALFVAFAASTLVFLRRLPVAVQGAQRLASFFANWGWLLVGVSCLWLAYMVVWHRGFFLDDWSIGLLARDRETLEWKPLTISRDTIPTFPARILTFIVTPRLVALMWTNEFVVRLIIACCVAVNAFLLGWLVHRMTRMKLPAVGAGWLFLVPTVYTDVTLWAGAVTYVFVSGLTLVVLHIAWSIMSKDGPLYLWLIVASVLWLLTLFWAETTIGALGLIPIMAFVLVLQKPSVKLRKLIYRGGLFTGSLLLVTGLFVFFVINNSPLLEDRGGIHIDIGTVIHRIDSWARTAYWLTLSPNWGYRLARESFFVGLDFLIKSQYGNVLLSVVIANMVLNLFIWSDNKLDDINLMSVISVFFLGLLWFLLTLYFPYFLVTNQILERRFLYFPLAGGIVSLVSLASLVRRDTFRRLVLSLLGFIVVVLCCCSVGQARVFKMQYETDMKMFHLIRDMAVPEKLPQKVLFMSINLDFWLPEPENRINGLIVSAFEASWSGRAGLGIVYPHKEIEYIPFSRWVPTRFSVQDHSCSMDRSVCGESQCPNRSLHSFVVNGHCVDPARVVLFTSRNGRPLLVKSLRLKREDGMEKIVSFPLVENIDPEGKNSIESVSIFLEY